MRLGGGGRERGDRRGIAAATTRGQCLPFVPLCEELGTSCHHLLGRELAHAVVLYLACLNHQCLVLEGRGEEGRGEERGQEGRGEEEKG